MTSSELMCAAIANGDTADATVGAALDALREVDGYTLLAAVELVATVVKAARDGRDMKEATAHLAEGSPLRNQLHRSILAECLDVPSGAEVLLLVVDGDRWPSSQRRSNLDGAQQTSHYLVSVGALWVKREATRLQLENERAAKNRRRRHR